MTYANAHHALICCFVDHARPAAPGWHLRYDPKSRDDVRLDLRGEDVVARRLVSALSGMEEVAGEAANVWKHLLRMSDARASALILRVCPALLRHPSIPDATTKHPWYEGALLLLTEDSASAVTGLSKHQARRDAVRRATGAKVNVGITADRCDVSRRTVERLNGAVKAWIKPIEDQAWREIEDRLEVAGLIERS